MPGDRLVVIVTQEGRVAFCGDVKSPRDRLFPAFQVQPRSVPFVAVLFPVIQVREDRLVNAIRYTAAKGSGRSRKGHHATRGLGGAAVVVGTLPEASFPTAQGRGLTIEEGEVDLINERAVAEYPVIRVRHGIPCRELRRVYIDEHLEIAVERKHADRLGEAVMESRNGPRGGDKQALVIGAGGGIGGAVVARLARDSRFERIWAIRRSPDDSAPWADDERVTQLPADHSESGIRATLEFLGAQRPALSRVVIALGALHGPRFQPEKSLDALDSESLLEIYRINCVLPLLWVAGIGRVLRRSPDCRVAVLSARVGSIGDNHLGGWYSYRCAKAALNMGLKSAAIELARRAKGLKLVAYHPGTVDTPLSEPFQRSVPEGRLFAPDFTAERLLGLLDQHPADGVLSYLDYEGAEIPW